MQVGDLLKSKCKYNFEKLGFAILLELDENLAIIYWINDETDYFLRLRELKEFMEIVPCK